MGVAAKGMDIRDWLPKPVAATLVVSAADSLHPERADLHCVGASDEDVINLAIDTGRKVFLLEGNYNIDGPITAAVNNVTLEGCGRGTIITLANNSDCHVLTIGGDGWAIKNLTIDGNGANQGVGAWYGIIIDSKDEGLLENIFVTNCDNLGAYFTAGSLRWRVISSEFSNTLTGSGIQSYANAAHFLIDNCVFRNNGPGGTGAGIGVNQSYDWLISNSHFDGNGYCHINVGETDACSRVAVTNCHFTGVANGSSVRFYRGSYYSMTNCISYEDLRDFLMINDASHVTITGNTIYHPTFSGISIQSGVGACSFITIGNNTIHNCGEGDAYYGIFVGTGNSDVVIEGNVLEEDRGGDTPRMNYGIFSRSDRVSIVDNLISGCDFAGINLEGDDCKIQDNLLVSTAGIICADGDDLLIQNNRIVLSTTPIDINNAAVVRAVVTDNNWEGCTNDPSFAAATNPMFQQNVAINGDWFPGDPPVQMKPAVVRYVVPGWFILGETNQAVIADTIYYQPIFVSETTTYDRIGIEINAGVVGLADLRIFEWDHGVPGALVLSAGTVATGAPGVQEINISQELRRGYYFLAIRVNAAPTLVAANPNTGIMLPVPGIRTTAGMNVNNVILLRFAAYADPAPAPNAIAAAWFAFIFMREA